MKRRNYIAVCFILCITFLFSACYERGDYQYIIHMKDGTKVEAWSVKPIGGALSVSVNWEDNTYYLLSNDQYVSVEYVGLCKTNK